MMSLYESFRGEHAKDQESAEGNHEENGAYLETKPEGIRRDLERAFHAASRWEYLQSAKTPIDLRILANEVFARINVPPEHLPAFTEDVIRAMRDAVEENSDWKDYSDVYLGPILEKLKSMGVPVKIKSAEEIKKEL